MWVLFDFGRWETVQLEQSQKTSRKKQLRLWFPVHSTIGLLALTYTRTTEHTGTSRAQKTCSSRAQVGVTLQDSIRGRSHPCLEGAGGWEVYEAYALWHLQGFWYALHFCKMWPHSCIIPSEPSDCHSHGCWPPPAHHVGTCKTKPSAAAQENTPGSLTLGEEDRYHGPLPVPSAGIDANEPTLIPQELSHPCERWNVLQEHKGTWQHANILHLTASRVLDGMFVSCQRELTLPTCLEICWLPSWQWSPLTTPK